MEQIVDNECQCHHIIDPMLQKYSLFYCLIREFDFYNHFHSPLFFAVPKYLCYEWRVHHKENLTHTSKISDECRIIMTTIQRKCYLWACNVSMN